MIVFKGGARSATGHRTGLGKSFSGVTRYLEHGSRGEETADRVTWSATRNLALEDPRHAAQIMRHTAGEFPRVEKPVYHFGLSLAPGETLSKEQWLEAADLVLERMGFKDHQALIIAHGDTDKEHIHIVVNRVGPDGRGWEPYRDMVPAYEAVKEIEARYGLRLTGRDQPLPALTSGSLREARRTGIQPLQDRVREDAGYVFAIASNWRELEESLARHGYRLEPARRGSGLVVTDGERRASLSKVDRTLSSGNLAARFRQTFRDYRSQAAEPPVMVFRSGQLPVLPAGSLNDRAKALIDRVTSTRATFTRADIERAAFREKDSVALAHRAFERGEIVPVGKDATGHTRYASLEYLKHEERLFTAAQDLAGRSSHQLPDRTVSRALEQRGLSAEQAAATLHATQGQDLVLIVGRAGSGKTTTAAAIADAYREAGYDVRGAALAGKAAEALERGAGIPSRTLHSCEQAWARGQDQLGRSTVLVVDEAGMVDTRQLARVLDHAAERQAKVILIGDPEQLKPIGAGDGYRGLLEQHQAVRLDTIRRQTEPWQREASERLAQGRVAPALDRYQDAGRLHVASTREVARAELVGQFTRDRAAEPDRQQLALAYRNADVRLLNEGIRAERAACGELGPGVVVAGAEYSAGDRVVFLRNDHAGRDVTLAAGAQQPPERTADPGLAPAGQGVKNGTLATLESVSPERFIGRLDDGRRVEWSPEKYDRFAHGYAVTVHKSQGATVDRAYVLLDERMNRHASYVALTRHREGVHIYADRGTFKDRERLDRVLSRVADKDLARDYGVAAIERHAERLGPLAERAASLRAQQQQLGGQLSAWERADSLSQRLAEHRGQLEKAVRRVYAEPREAMTRLLVDPRGAERLAAGDIATYGEMRGWPAATLRGPDQARLEATRAVPAAQRALDSYHLASAQAAEANAAAHAITNPAPYSAAPLNVPPVPHPHQQAQAPVGPTPGPPPQAPGAPGPLQSAPWLPTSVPNQTAQPQPQPRPGPGPALAQSSPTVSVPAAAAGRSARGLATAPELRIQIADVRQALARIETALQGPSKALEAVIREVGVHATRLAISALPPPLRMPVQLASRVAERVIDLGRELNR